MPLLHRQVPICISGQCIFKAGDEGLQYKGSESKLLADLADLGLYGQACVKSTYLCLLPKNLYLFKCS